ncbi:alpha/beta hydrolase [Streptomyces sp. MS1.HAVA.3]|uniref:Alpha/beta hydrolase n=1 Tax=Streptomyces caledonius TaxID=3134107 RepID=A0ABU8UD79_9ACTN
MFKVLSSDGTAIACERHGGAGPTLVLVGGTLMTRARHAPLASLLARDFSVVNYDRRGRGDSGDHPVYDVQREVDDLDAVIERVGGPVMLFGMSSGAVLALEAVARGSAVSALALYEPPFVVDPTRPPLPVDYVDRMKAVIARATRRRPSPISCPSACPCRTKPSPGCGTPLSGLRGRPPPRPFPTTAR